MKRYQRVIRETVRAKRFDSFQRLPRGVKATNHPRLPYVAEILNPNGEKIVVPIKFGDWIVTFYGGGQRVINHDAFSEEFREVETLDCVDVTDEYRSRKEGDHETEKSSGARSADAEVSPSRDEGQDEVQSEAETQEKGDDT